MPPQSNIRVALHRGRWPSYGQPDPKSLPAVFGPIPAWLEVALPPALWMGLTALAYAFIRRFIPPRWRIWAGILLIFASGGLGWAWMMIDPGGVLEWYFD